jgi:DNA polymerase-3 subunit gamma/tau
VVGQDHITDILSRALKANKIAHAYLFTGPRGVGKTSIARILAHEINQLPYDEDHQHLDIIEIDAASNNGVEDVRDLREKVQIAPVSAAKKVYIIDEVHMLSKPAFNALLKTLEEPPAHVVFILATTDVEKLPATIVSRTQRFGFRAIQPSDAIEHLKTIAKAEHIKVSDDALALIASRGDGSFRDSISLLDQLSSLVDEGEEITAALIETALGLAPSEIIESLLEAVEKHDVPALAMLLTRIEADGMSPIVINEQLTAALRSRVVEKPQWLGLLDALLDVPKSTQPSMKLLSVLGTAAYEHKPKSVALATPVLEVSATIEELEAKATEAHPAEPEPLTDTIITAAPRPKKISKATAEFQWEALLAHTKEHYIALHSVLAKCGFAVEKEVLTLFTQNAFYKKKLDDAKYSVHLYDSLQAIGAASLSIETVAERAPLKDSQAQAIADIMGGGTVVAADAA